MATAPTKWLSPQEYLARERQAEIRSEYLQGEMIALASTNYQHSLIKGNLAGETGNQLKEGPCHVLTSDMRVKVDASGLYTYPDIAIVCSEPEFEDRH